MSGKLGARQRRGGGRVGIPPAGVGGGSGADRCGVHERGGPGGRWRPSAGPLGGGPLVWYQAEPRHASRWCSGGLLAAVLLVVALAAAGAWAPAAAQQQPPRPAANDTTELRQAAEDRLGEGVTHAEIIERLRQSGMTRSQIRTRLQQMGYDPRLADRYFDVLERGGEPPEGMVPEEMLEALRRLRLTPATADTVPPLHEIEIEGLDELLEPEEPAVFGRALFQRATTQFEPVLAGPVDADYRLGPGDELVLFLTGDVELAYTLDVSREGYVVIPDVGQVFVAGVTLGGLRERLYDRLGRVYSGVRRGPEATTHFQVSLARLRTNQVYLVGEVEWPGSYQVSAVATVFNALYRAGGPTRQGSFRRIEVRRGGRVVGEVDLYDYLLRGDSRADIRLEQGDIVFVPMAQTQVLVEGAVRRPAIYEVRPEEGLRDLLAHAGGLKSDAVVRRIQIDRILPPDRRRPGVDRVLMDVDVHAIARPDGERVALNDGDVVQVFGVSEERRHRVVVSGQVRRPGTYEWVPGSTIWDLIERAEGLDERAYTPRAHIYRLNEADGSRRLIHTPLLADESGRALRDVALADRDSVVVLSREDLSNPETVAIDGFVKNPATYSLADGMTVQDLVLAAGGFIHGADLSHAEVARMPMELHRTDATAEVIQVPLTPMPPPTEGAGGEGQESRLGFGSAPGRALVAGAEVPDWVPHSDEFQLMHGDRVVIRRAPGYEPPRTVQVTGQVVRPGTYVLERRQERLTEILERAGGLTREANPAGLQVIREGHLVGTKLETAWRAPNTAANLRLEAGDSIHVPEHDPTVLVTGAVIFESRVLYDRRSNLHDYIRRSGGFADNADTRRVTILYPNGERETVRRTLLFTRLPRVEPGSTIFVPDRPGDRGFNWERFATVTATVMTATATFIIAIDRIR